MVDFPDETDARYHGTFLPLANPMPLTKNTVFARNKLSVRGKYQ